MDDKNKFGENASFEELAKRYSGGAPDQPKNTNSNSSSLSSGRDMPLAPPTRSSLNSRNPVTNVNKPTKKAEPASNKRRVQPDNARSKQTKQVKNNQNNRPNNSKTTSNRNIPNKQGAVKVQKDKNNKSSNKKQNKFLTEFLNNEQARSTYIFFGVVIVLSVLVATYAVLCVNDILAITKSKDEVTISSTNIETANDAIDLLHDNKLITCPNFSKLFVKVRNSKTLNPPYTKGVFSVNGKMGLEGMLTTLKGDVATKETVTITFPEGYTIPQIIDKLAEEKVCDKTTLYEAIEKTELTYALTADLKTNDSVAFRLEGYLFPDTYEFYVGENPNSVLKKFVSNLEDQISQEDRAQAEKLDMSINEVLTLASIIQKEAANTKQMKTISSILHNRLNNESTYPLLECDSTGDYVSKFVAKSLTVNSKHDAAFYNDNYNTYVTRGLPAGPICNPGKDAINAALYPEKTKYYFFCHDEKRNMYTAETLSQHRANVAKYVVS